MVSVLLLKAVYKYTQTHRQTNLKINLFIFPSSLSTSAKFSFYPSCISVCMSIRLYISCCLIFLFVCLSVWCLLQDGEGRGGTGRGGTVSQNYRKWLSLSSCIPPWVYYSTCYQERGGREREGGQGGKEGRTLHRRRRKHGTKNQDPQALSWRREVRRREHKKGRCLQRCREWRQGEAMVQSRMMQIQR